MWRCFGYSSRAEPLDDAESPATTEAHSLVVAPAQHSQGFAAQPESDLECAICFENIVEGTALPCACTVNYCMQCWDQALTSSFAACGQARCPTCRSPVQVDFDGATGRLIFSRQLRADNVSATDWIHQQARPAQIQLLQRYGAEQRLSEPVVATFQWVKASFSSTFMGGAAYPQPRCICRGVLTKLSGLECYLRFCSRLHPDLEYGSDAWEREAHRIIRRAERNPDQRITCDLCAGTVTDADGNVLHRSGDIFPTEDQYAYWCENGRGTILHTRGYYICDECYYRHTRGDVYR